MIGFNKFQFKIIIHSHLFNSEIENLIFNYCEQNGLILPDDFRRCHYKFFMLQNPKSTELLIMFIARKKTQDDIFREQIEFKIQQLEK